MNKIKAFFYDLLELYGPIIFVILGIIGISFDDFFRSIGIDFFSKLICYSNENMSSITPLIATIGTVFCAVVLTTLSVFGSTTSYSVAIISKDKDVVKRFIIAAIFSLLGSALLFIMSTFQLFPIKLYLSILIFSFSSLWTYTSMTIYMFYINIVNTKKEKDDNNQLLKEVRIIKSEVRNIKKIIHHNDNS